MEGFGGEGKPLFRSFTFWRRKKMEGEQIYRVYQPSKIGGKFGRIEKLTHIKEHNLNV